VSTALSPGDLSNGSRIVFKGCDVAIVIPVLNEEQALSLVLRDIPKEHVRTVIVVDNGSTDESARVARDGGAIVVSEPQRGYGRAVQAGLKQVPATCDTVVILDGDHSDFPEDLPSLLAPIREGRADLVIGSRTQAALPGSLMPQQRFGNWLTCVLIQALYRKKFTDMGPFRAITRTALDGLNMEDPTFGWNVEMQVKAVKRQLRIIEVPVRYRPRIGQSKISGTLKGSAKAGLIILYSIWKYGVRRGKLT
jgi:glycosyltransferase involved in cell wall biosynthesis